MTAKEDDEEGNRKRRKKQRDSRPFREEEEVRKDEGRFVVRMAVSFVGEEEEGATLRLRNLSHSRGADGGSGPPEKAVSVYRPNGFSTPPTLPIR